MGPNGRCRRGRRCGRACAPADEARARHIASPDRALIALATQVMFELDTSGSEIWLCDMSLQFCCGHSRDSAAAMRPSRNLGASEHNRAARGGRTQAWLSARAVRGATPDAPTCPRLDAFGRASTVVHAVESRLRAPPEIITAATEQAVTLLRVASARLSSSWRTHPAAFARDRLALTLLSPVDELSTKKAKHSGLSIYNEAGDAAAA